MLPDQSGLEGLRQSWGPSREWLLWGMTGFFLGGEVATPEVLALFVIYVPMVVTAVLLPALSLSAKGSGWQVVMGGAVMGAAVFPLAANWVWGGGWLSQLGSSLDLGYGFVDYGGSATVYLLGGAYALGGLIGLRRRLPIPDPDAPDELPPAHFPLLANLGALLFGLGWLGWSLSRPFHVVGAEMNLPLIAVNGLLASAGAGLGSHLYSWLAIGKADPLLTSRGVATGLVAASAAAPFIPTWSALVIGVTAGLLLPLGAYVTRRLARLPDATGAVPIGLIGGALGVLAVPLFADGRWGRGWNSLVLDVADRRAGQGVTGFFPAAGRGFIENGRGQSLAQLVGMGVILLLGVAVGWLLLLALTARERSRARMDAGAPTSSGENAASG